jgi:hypothetical protein
MTCRPAPVSGRQRIVSPDEISEAPRRGHSLEQNPKHGFFLEGPDGGIRPVLGCPGVGPPDLIEVELRSGRYVFAQERGVKR